MLNKHLKHCKFYFMLLFFYIFMQLINNFLLNNVKMLISIDLELYYLLNFNDTPLIIFNH